MKIILGILLTSTLLTLPALLAATVRPVLELSEGQYNENEATTYYQTSTEECPIDSTNKCESNIENRADISSISGDNIKTDTPSQLKLRVKETDSLIPVKFEINPSTWQADDTLKQVVIIHRHGDRTPITFSPKDPLRSEPFWTFHGLGQLTNRGKARLHLLGKLMRSRYNKFMNNSVNKNQVTSRSSGSLRCIESAQTFLSSFLDVSLNDSDSKELVWDKPSNRIAQLWQPAAVQSAPVAIDGMLAEGSTCKNLAKEYESISNSNEAKKINSDYSHEAKVFESAIGFEIDAFYKWFWASSMIEVERSYFPDKMLPAIMSVYDRVQVAGNKALKLYQSSLRSKRLRGGLLIGDIVKHLENYRDSSQTGAEDSDSLKKFVHYAAHDLTNVVLLGILGNWDRFGERPSYASNIAFELHEDKKEWFVRVFYMETVPSEPVELRLENCYSASKPSPVPDTGRRCTLDGFKEMVKPYLIERWIDWMKECDNDLSSINPYETTH